ncbi:MAG: SurA N-terminal domain-containing protein [Deferrisomatales bacterium]
MLEQIRKNVRHPYIQALLGLVILVFIFFFGWSMRASRPTYVAKVNGDVIDYRAYQQAYNGLLRLYQEAYKEDLTPERIRQMGLGRRALDQLVDRTLLLQEAARRGFEVSDRELQQAIQSVQAFQDAGTFRKDLYLRVLDANRLTPMEFEASKRQELLLAKVEQAIRDEARVGDEEVEQEYRDRNTRLDLAYVVFDPRDFEADVSAPEEKLAEFYEAEKESFRTPEKRSARYVRVAPEPFLDAVEVDEEEIRSEFGWRAGEFAVREAVRARHILLRLPPDADAAAEERVRKRIEEIRKEALAGADFAELAKKYSEDPGSKEQGGDLGYFERGRMVPAFEAVAFSLDPGAVSEPVKSPFGYHLIRVEDHRQAREPTYEEVRDRIAEDIRRRKALEEAYAAADNLLMDLEDGQASWEGLAEDRDVRTTPLVARGEPVEGVEKPTEFAELLFSLDPDSPGRLLETPAGTYVISVARVEPSRVPELDEVREPVTLRYRKAEARRLAEEAARAFLGEVAQKGWEPAVAALGKPEERTGPFTRKGGAVPKIGWAPQLKEAAFRLDAPGAAAEEPVEINGKFYAVRAAERTEADPAGLEAVKEKLRAELLPAKQTAHFEAYLKKLREEADLEVNEDLLIS